MNTAQRLLAAYDRASLVALPSAQTPAFDLPAAFVLAEQVRQARIARGEKPVGYKIGFTNRSIWQRYGVHQPIWGPVWDSTTTLLESADAHVCLTGLSQPRLEPEVVFGFARTPRAGMSESELQGCLDWVAHGVEIVHTHFDGWRFTAADTVADFALHGRLYVGPRVSVRGWSTLGADLASLRVQLACDGTVVDTGQGATVLDGPLNALRLWVDAMVLHTPDWPILPGHCVTTGTITDAWALRPGQTWSTELSESRLWPLRLQILP